MKYLFSILLLSAFAFGAKAQPITITESDYLNMEYSLNGEVMSFTAQNLSSLLSLTADSGANQTWDFTRSTYLGGIGQRRDTIPPSEAPLAKDPDFSEATNVIVAPKILG